jgi:hypothetical protein
VLLPSVQVRREVFDEYCRERARELRESSVKKQKEVADPKEAFELLLQEEVTSTRASWTDFRRAWKKDRRFWGWGRDDREREKRFREFVKALGESQFSCIYCELTLMCNRETRGGSKGGGRLLHLAEGI